MIVHGAVLVSAFLIFWFLALFILIPIPIGGRNPETGAPLKPMLARKAVYATAAAAALFAIFYALIALKVIDL
jgi:predicted secreted protein